MPPSSKKRLPLFVDHMLSRTISLTVSTTFRDNPASGTGIAIHCCLGFFRTEYRHRYSRPFGLGSETLLRVVRLDQKMPYFSHLSSRTAGDTSASISAEVCGR